MDTSKIARYIWIGRRDINWYHDCEQLFCELFGRERLIITAQLFAATSINSSLETNVTLFRKALYEIENNLPTGAYLPNIKNQIMNIREGRELSGRKIRSFAAAMSGDVNAVVVDIWLLRAFGMSKQHMRHTGPHAGRLRDNGASNSQYTKIENYVREESAAMGIEPRQMSSMLWAGVRINTNGYKETHYARLLRHQFTTLFT